jgi:hypothetical protein
VVSFLGRVNGNRRQTQLGIDLAGTDFGDSAISSAVQRRMGASDLTGEPPGVIVSDKANSPLRPDQAHRFH